MQRRRCRALAGNLLVHLLPSRRAASTVGHDARSSIMKSFSADYRDRAQGSQASMGNICICKLRTATCLPSTKGQRKSRTGRRSGQTTSMSYGSTGTGFRRTRAGRCSGANRWGLRDLSGRARGGDAKRPAVGFRQAPRAVGTREQGVGGSLTADSVGTDTPRVCPVYPPVTRSDFGPRKLEREDDQRRSEPVKKRW